MSIDQLISTDEIASRVAPAHEHKSTYNPCRELCVTGGKLFLPPSTPHHFVIPGGALNNAFGRWSRTDTRPSTLSQLFRVLRAVGGLTKALAFLLFVEGTSAGINEGPTLAVMPMNTPHFFERPSSDRSPESASRPSLEAIGSRVSKASRACEC